MANFGGLTAKGVPQTLPRFLLPIRLVIFFLALVILAISAYNLSLFGGYGYLIGGSGPAGFNIFDAIFTFITLGAILYLEFKKPDLYLRPLVLFLYFLNLVFWLSAWSWCASVASVWLGVTCYGGYCSDSNSNVVKYGATLAAAAGLGALLWVLVILTAVFFIRACLLEDRTGTSAELGNVGGQKSQPYITQTEAVMQPQPQYQQQQQQQPQYSYGTQA